MDKNSRLLRLAGGCEHDWSARPHIERGENGWLYFYRCPKCGLLQAQPRGKSFSLPAVGDGHRMTCDELLAMANWLWPGINVRFYPEGNKWFCELTMPDGEVLRHKQRRPGRALGELILQAKGELL